ncbi:MAG: hypothetical protein SOT81_04195 [Treponema sp.]|nr:hypothetical protein [Treponema sp.]
MKKMLAVVILFAGLFFGLNAEEFSSEEDIDNVYTIEWTLNTDTNSVEIRLFALNTDAFDETFGNNSIDEELSGILSDYGYTGSSLVSETKDENFDNGKYTMLIKKFSLQ